MITKAARTIADEWRESLFFVTVILGIGSLTIYLVQGALLRGGLFFFGLCIYNAYFLHLGMALKGVKTAHPIKFILFGKDKARYDFFVLLALFGAIFLILSGPFILFQSLLMKKISEISISHRIVNMLFSAEVSIRPLIILYNIAILVGYCIFKISLYSAVSSLTYERHEVLEAFKDGVRGITRFIGLLTALVAYEIAVLFLLWITEGSIQNGITLIAYLIPAAIMFLMSCSYSLSDESLPRKPEVNDTAPAAPGEEA